MSGSVRYVLAVAFGLLWWAMPEPDHGRLAVLQTKAWLTDDVLTAWVDGETGAALGAMPPLRASVRVQQERTIADDAAAFAAELARDLERVPRTFARGRGIPYAEDAEPSALELLVGRLGFRARFAGEVVTVDGETVARVAREIERLEEGAPGTYYPDRNSLLPAFVAIVLAVLFGQVITALFIGSLVGAWFTARSFLGGVELLVTDTIARDVMTDQFRIEVIMFVVFLFMAIGVMTRSGGVQGLADAVRRLARGPLTTQLATYLIGLAIFFDDYANCVITGTTMRPLADRNRIAREKLAYIVDSTAAPIAGISIFSTWVAYEISQFAPQLPEVTRPDGTPFQQTEGFAVFISTLPFRFYCVFTLFMVLLTIVLRRDYGPMGAAQKRAFEEGKPNADDATPMLSGGFERLSPAEGTPRYALNAFVPLLALVVATITGIVVIGYRASDPADLAAGFGPALRTILNNTQSQRALWIASLIALALATAFATLRSGMSVIACLTAAARAARSLGFAIVILILAWTIGATCDDLGTAEYLTAAFQGRFPPWLLPAVMFLLASLVSFSTGTSYGTMAILLPNVVVLAHATGESAAGLTGAAMMYLTIGAVLEGSIFGDHCSPISDTTVLSSVATGSDHLHHVRTQAPYALTVMAIALGIGYLPMTTLGTEYWSISWLVGAAVIAGVLFVLGTRAHTPPPIEQRPRPEPDPVATAAGAERAND